VLDLALLYARSGWTIFLRCLAAGMAANRIAFAVRFLVGGGGGGRGSSTGDLLLRISSYVICGALAGLMGAMVFLPHDQTRGDGGSGEFAVAHISRRSWLG